MESTMIQLRTIIAGAGGRMGAAIAAAVHAHPQMKLVGALGRSQSSSIGKDIGLTSGLGELGVIITDAVDPLLEQADVIIDFTTPGTSASLARSAAQHRLVHLIGTTGVSDSEQAAIASAADAGARIVQSGNFSPGMVALAALVEKASAALAEYDIEIVEMHHNQKVDAPSGSALILGEAAARGREISLNEHAVGLHDVRDGVRQTGTIGFASLRGGNVIGDHTVVFAGPSERIELTHKAQDRSIYANGTIRAALWAINQPAGLYSMEHVLGLAP